MSASYIRRGVSSPFSRGSRGDKELSGPSPREAKKLRQETRRTNKWIKMLKRWDHYLPSEKVWGRVWLRLLNVDQVKARNAGKYQEMKEAALVSSRDIMQIDLDVNQTFHSHIMFWDRYGVGQRALFHVLAANSVYDTEVGYCQGMSDHGHPPHVPARGGCLLGAGPADNG
ncbi:USP6 N-terminal-like protein [Vulpes lagopus]